MDTGRDMKNEKRVNLSNLISREKTKFSYIYDWGDCWVHEILLEKIIPFQKGTRYPVCLAGKRACPPENCGGPSGYKELLEILSDPSHSEHEERFGWLSGDFDSEKFDMESVNRTLRGSRQQRNLQTNYPRNFFRYQVGPFYLAVPGPFLLDRNTFLLDPTQLSSVFIGRTQKYAFSTLSGRHGGGSVK